MTASQPDVLERAEARLRRRGIRATTARRLVLEALHVAPGPQSAADLGETLRGAVPQSSIYRTLGTLVDAGVAARHHDPAGLARFEIAESLTGHHHHHVVCLGCGETHDVDISPQLERAITGFSADAEGDLGFAITGHRVDLEGWCRRCR